MTRVKEVDRLIVALEKIRKLAKEGSEPTTVPHQARAKHAQALKQIDEIANEAIEWIEHRKRNQL